LDLGLGTRAVGFYSGKGHRCGVALNRGGLPRVQVFTCTSSPVPSDPCRSPLPPLVQLVAAGHSVAEMRALLAPMLSSGHDQAPSNTLTHHHPLIHLPLKHTPKSKSKLIQYYTPRFFLIFCQNLIGSATASNLKGKHFEHSKTKLNRHTVTHFTHSCTLQFPFLHS